MALLTYYVGKNIMTKLSLNQFTVAPRLLIVIGLPIRTKVSRWSAAHALSSKANRQNELINKMKTTDWTYCNVPGRFLIISPRALVDNMKTKKSTKCSFLKETNDWALTNCTMLQDCLTHVLINNIHPYQLTCFASNGVTPVRHPSSFLPPCKTCMFRLIVDSRLTLGVNTTSVNSLPTEWVT